jgi:hypothetical protein
MARNVVEDPRAVKAEPRGGQGNLVKKCVTKA